MGAPSLLNPSLVRYAYLVNAAAATAAWLCFFSGGFTADALLDGYYEIQAHAIAQGSLAASPGPETHFYHDASLYRGNYYFYWGLLPSIAYTAASTLLSRTAAHYAVVGLFLFCFCYFYQRIIGLLIEVSLTAEDRRRSVWLLTALPLLWLFVFVLPFPASESSWFFSRFEVYEQQVLFGTAVAMAGVYFILRALTSRDPTALCAASALLAPAAWTRGTWLAPAGLTLFAALLLSGRAIVRGETFPGGVKAVAWLGAAAALLAGLFVVNYVRFDSFLDFGVFVRQHPMGDRYLRVITGFFSPATKFWNALFNFVSYYGPPDMVHGLKLEERSYSIWEGRPPAFFFHNPHFAALTVLTPLALYRAWKVKRPLFGPLVALLIVTACMNGIVVCVGPIVVMRFFVEFYYFLIALFFAILLALVPARFAAPLIAVALALYAPHNLRMYASGAPDLRLANVEEGFTITTRAGLPDFLFVVKDARWPHGRAAPETRNAFTQYNVVGVYPAGRDRLTLSDTAAVYIIPETVPGLGLKKGRVVLSGLMSLLEDGSTHVYVDGAHVGSKSLERLKAVDVSFPTPFPLQPRVPYQVLIVFFPSGRSYLAERPPPRPPLSLTEIRLQRRASNGPATGAGRRNTSVKPDRAE